ncbi:unnamed protein product [Lepeophtheirus salmonis]|uniref:(salmon louse) hypothetical protein n=1 Tax=Lepeophtheirus salmonis TaxID=72036 RepID=A0A7R8H498_LEPSM|nr:unnamed protein product [Lepeophtheirus salmonis]CAF2844262.1 unnamed protein product [Lepeophtheirus salmonis]
MMKSIARCTSWWCNVDNDIKNLVNACNICQANNVPSPPAKYVSSSPACPWERLHVDSLQFKGKDFLIFADAGSKWIEAEAMSNTSTSHTLQKLLYCFSKCSFPKWLHFDTRPQFENNIIKSKIQGERAVRILKDMKKMNPGIFVDELLFTYHSSPLSCEKSPAELLFSQYIRTCLDGLLPKKATE